MLSEDIVKEPTIPQTVSQIAAAALSLAVLAAILLTWFGVKLWRASAPGKERTRGKLMVVMAIVLLMNVLILTI